MEIGADGQESTVTSYKQNGRVKRQGARFRVFEYDQEPDGTLRLSSLAARATGGRRSGRTR